MSDAVAYMLKAAAVKVFQIFLIQITYLRRNLNRMAKDIYVI
jgi:hypothetical protein